MLVVSEKAEDPRSAGACAKGRSGHCCGDPHVSIPYAEGAEAAGKKTKPLL